MSYRNISHEVEYSTPFRGETGPVLGSLRMDVVTYYGTLFREKEAYN